MKLFDVPLEPVVAGHVGELGLVAIDPHAEGLVAARGEDHGIDVVVAAERTPRGRAAPPASWGLNAL